MLKLGAWVPWQLGFAKFPSQTAGPCLQWLLPGWALTTSYVAPAKFIEKKNWIWHDPFSWEHHLYKSSWFLCLKPSPILILSVGRVEMSRSKKSLEKKKGIIWLLKGEDSVGLWEEYFLLLISQKTFLAFISQRQGTILAMRQTFPLRFLWSYWKTMAHIR